MSETAACLLALLSEGFKMIRHWDGAAYISLHDCVYIKITFEAV